LNPIACDLLLVGPGESLADRRGDLCIVDLVEALRRREVGMAGEVTYLHERDRRVVGEPADPGVSQAGLDGSEWSWGRWPGARRMNGGELAERKENGVVTITQSGSAAYPLGMRFYDELVGSMTPAC
jgi:hypothetical protein